MYCLQYLVQCCPSNLFLNANIYSSAWSSQMFKCFPSFCQLIFTSFSFFKDVEGMMSISVEAAAARDSLSDDKEIVNTYEVA